MSRDSQSPLAPYESVPLPPAYYAADVIDLLRSLRKWFACFWFGSFAPKGDSEIEQVYTRMGRIEKRYKTIRYSDIRHQTD